MSGGLRRIRLHFWFWSGGYRARAHTSCRTGCGLCCRKGTWLRRLRRGALRCGRFERRRRARLGLLRRSGPPDMSGAADADDLSLQPARAARARLRAQRERALSPYCGARASGSSEICRIRLAETEVGWEHHILGCVSRRVYAAPRAPSKRYRDACYRIEQTCGARDLQAPDTALMTNACYRLDPIAYV